MKISKVNHVRAGSAPLSDHCTGMLYNYPGQEGRKKLGNYIEARNENAKKLYNVYCSTNSSKYQEVYDWANLYFKNNLINQLSKQKSNEIILKSMMEAQSVAPDINKRSRRTKNRSESILETKPVEEVANNFTEAYLRKSLRKNIVDKYGDKVSSVEVFSKLLVCVLKKENYQSEIKKMDPTLLGNLIELVRTDYLKEKQLKHIQHSIENKSVPIQVSEDKKTLVPSSYQIEKKKFIFNFMKKYAGADEQGQKEILKKMRYLMLLYFYGKDMADDAYEGDLTDRSFGCIVQEQELLSFSPEAEALIDEFQGEVEKTEDKVAKAAVQRKKREQIQTVLRCECARHYNEAISCPELDDDDKAWIRFISNRTQRMFEKKSAATDKLKLKYLIRNTWKEWTAFIAGKYIDMGKGVYHFAMNHMDTITDPDTPTRIGKVADEYENGISSFDYERIKASDSLKRGLSGYAAFAVENFARACYKDEDRMKENQEDVLSLNDSNVEYRDNVKNRLLRYFGGESTWVDSDLECFDEEEIVKGIKIQLKIARNYAFHFIHGKSTNTDLQVVRAIFQKEYSEVGKMYRKQYYANNVPMFYKTDDIDRFMSYIYSNSEKYQPQIPSYNKVISRTYMPDIVIDFVKQSYMKKVSEPKLVEQFRNALYFVLKEIYYNAFIQEEDVLERFEKALKSCLDSNRYKKNKQAYENFNNRWKELRKLGLSFGEICQQIMTDYEQQNDNKLKRVNAYEKEEEGKNSIIKTPDKQIYKHYRTLLYIGIREAFLSYIKEKKEYFGFLREPLNRVTEFHNMQESDFVNGWSAHVYDSNMEETVMGDEIITSWYVTAHFLNPAQLNHLVGQIKTYIQFIRSIEQRAGSTQCRVDEFSEAHLQNYVKLLEVLDFVKIFSGQISHEVSDYYKDEDAFAAHIGKYVSYAEVHDHIRLQAFTNEKIKTKAGVQSVGLYYDGEHPILNRNIVQAMLYGNEKLLSLAMKPISKKEVVEYYKSKDALEPVFRSGVCKNNEQQKQLKEFQNLKNRIELVDVLTLSELVNSFVGQLINYAYMRERDHMYMQLGFHYVELYHTDKVPQDSFMRKLQGENCLIEDGAILYQIVAMYDYNLPLYARNDQGEAVIAAKSINGGIGAKVAQFYKSYCKDDGTIYNNGMYFFENISEQDIIVEERKYIDHFKYYVHLDKSILEMYSMIYDRFFDYDIKLKKSVSYIIPNILCSYFINADLAFDRKGEFPLVRRGKGGSTIKYIRKAANIQVENIHSDYFTYKLVDIENARNLEDVKRGKDELYVKARSDIFVDEVRAILNYKQEKKDD